MSEEPRPARERTQKLLRVWGAEEAARQSHPTPLNAMVLEQAEPRARVPAGGRWWPLAAGLVLFVGALALVAYDQIRVRQPAAVAGRRAEEEMARLNTRAEESARQAQESRAALEAREAESKALQGRLAEAALSLEQARSDQTRLQTEKERLAEKITGLEREAAGLTDRFGAQLGEAEKQLAAKQDALDKAAAELKKTQGEIDRLTGELARGAAVQQGLRDQLEASQAAARASEARVAALQAEQETARGLLRGRYLSSAAPGETGLLACQIAAEKNELVRRYAQLRGTIQSAEARAVCDRLETLLTQLNMLDTRNAEQVTAFLALLQRTAPGAQASKLLSSGPLDPPVRQWLIETQLVLSGG